MSTTYPVITVTLKGLRWFESGHPWIYQSDIEKNSATAAGLAELRDMRGKFLAYGLYSPTSKISFRVLTRAPEKIDRNWWKKKLLQAFALRERAQILSNAKRLVFGESDNLPSLIVDQYGDYLVFQTLSAGMEVFKPLIVELLQELLQPKGILEKNDATVRKQEKLSLEVNVVSGNIPERVIVQEAHRQFVVHLTTGQKTGAFLDLRDARFLAGRLSRGKVLDAFSYNGWFACHMAEQAESVLCVDSSAEACELVKENAKLNGFEKKIQVIEANAFDFLREQSDAKTKFDTVNVDPPAFAKHGKDKEASQRGYKEINLRALKLLHQEGLLISSSCSYAMFVGDFEEMLHSAALDTNMQLQILYRLFQTADHPTLTGFPESQYLKCFFSWASKMG